MITEEDKREVKKLAKLYGVKCYFYESKSHFHGYWTRRNNSINLNTIGTYEGTERDKSHLLGCFFHELGHTICYANDWYYNYHNDHLLKNNKNSKRLLRRIALRAERFVDKVGGKEFIKHYPDLSYPYFYSSKYAVDIFRKYYIEKHYKL